MLACFWFLMVLRYRSMSQLSGILSFSLEHRATGRLESHHDQSWSVFFQGTPQLPTMWFPFWFLLQTSPVPRELPLGGYLVL